MGLKNLIRDCVDFDFDFDFDFEFCCLALTFAFDEDKPIMNAFWLLVICWSHCVLTQPLQAVQHSALMSVYDALGSSHVDEVKVVLHSLFVFRFFFFWAGCNDATRCPRFDASSNCIGSGLICSDGNVTRLCVLASDVMCFVLTRDYSQEPFFPTIDWVDSVDDWTIDGTHLVVRVRGDYYYVGAHASGFARRSLGGNQLTSSIPSTIGQLTALRELYVFVLTIFMSELTFLASHAGISTITS
jgi:hypothetical protein